jgi:phosphatidate cytidylyltransferase
VLKQRVLTALLLVPPAVAAVLLLPTAWAGLALALVMLLAADEWARLAGLATPGARLRLILGVLLGIGALGWLRHRGVDLLPVFVLATLGWAGAALYLARAGEIRVDTQPAPAVAGAGFAVLAVTWGALVWLHGLAHGPSLLLGLLVLIWAADTGAYFVGRRWGRRKLAPRVSPGKTWEGAYGAFAVGLAWGGLLAWQFGGSPLHSLGLLGLCLATVAASIVGDLQESLLKRRRGLKDSGSLLPGHGGVLDRIDSLTAAAPVFAAGLGLLGPPA